jgi:putative hydrolase of the HAD superfamily
MELLPSREIAGGRVLRPLEAILFDVYGTLFISGSGDLGSSKIDTHTGSQLEQLLAQFGIKMRWTLLLEDFKQAIQNDHQEKQAAGVDYPEVRVEEIWAQVLGLRDLDQARKFALIFELLVNPVYPMPHLGDILAAVKQSGLMMGLISNAQFFTPFLFEAFLNRDLVTLGFDPGLTIFSFEHKVAKPSPILFQRAADFLSIKGIFPSAVLYVGNDMRNDIVPAQNLGFQTALFAGDRRSLRWRRGDKLVRGYQPDMVVVKLLELLRWIP